MESYNYIYQLLVKAAYQRNTLYVNTFLSQRNQVSLQADKTKHLNNKWACKVFCQKTFQEFQKVSMVAFSSWQLQLAFKLSNFLSL